MRKWSVIVLDVDTGKTFETQVRVSRSRAYHIALAWPFVQTKLLAIPVPRRFQQRISKALSSIKTRKSRAA